MSPLCSTMSFLSSFLFHNAMKLTKDSSVPLLLQREEGSEGLGAYRLAHSEDIAFFFGKIEDIAFSAAAASAPTVAALSIKHTFSMASCRNNALGIAISRLRTCRDKEAALISLGCICSGIFSVSQGQATILNSFWLKQMRPRTR